jgi:uncharacterized protein YjgD (DUF1641 family)
MARLMKMLLLLLLHIGLAPTVALFNNKKKEEEQVRNLQAADDVAVGLSGIKHAAHNPAVMRELMQSMKDPEIMQEAQKMMADPAFQKQMRAMMGDKAVADATSKAKAAFAELSNDPAKMAAMASKVETILAGGETRPDLSEGMRREARAAAGEQFGIKAAPAGVDRSIDGATNARLGFASLQDSISDPKAMADAMLMMKDPKMLAEARRMMEDPSFRAEFEAMKSNPEFQSAMSKSASAMSAMMNDPDAPAKIQRGFDNMRR